MSGLAPQAQHLNQNLCSIQYLVLHHIFVLLLLDCHNDIRKNSSILFVASSLDQHRVTKSASKLVSILFFMSSLIIFCFASYSFIIFANNQLCASSCLALLAVLAHIPVSCAISLAVLLGFSAITSATFHMFFFLSTLDIF
jgi:hypothetical protein